MPDPLQELTIHAHEHVGKENQPHEIPPVSHAFIVAMRMRCPDWANLVLWPKTRRSSQLSEL